MRVLATTLVLAGCGYQPGSFRKAARPFPGLYATVGCLDVAVDRRPDLPDGRPVVAYAFGNRCDHPAMVDLADARVIARTADGRTRALAAFDPYREIEPLRIDARSVGDEAIAYVTASPVRDLCVDAAAIADAAPPRWLCAIAPKEVQ